MDQSLRRSRRLSKNIHNDKQDKKTAPQPQPLQQQLPQQKQQAIAKLEPKIKSKSKLETPVTATPRRSRRLQGKTISSVPSVTPKPKRKTQSPVKTNIEEESSDVSPDVKRSKRLETKSKPIEKPDSTNEKIKKSENINKKDNVSTTIQTPLKRSKRLLKPEVKEQSKEEPKEVEKEEVKKDIVVKPKQVRKPKKELKPKLNEEIIESKEDKPVGESEEIEINDNKLLNDEESEVKELKRVNEKEVPTKDIKRLKKAQFEVPTRTSIGGKVLTFGDEIAGELGPRETLINGVKIKRNEPTFIRDFDENVVQVVCGALHTVCLTVNGEVYTFGCNDDYALGRQTTGTEKMVTDDDGDSADDSDEILASTPTRVNGLPNIVKISAGDMHTVALSDTGNVFVWGNFKDDSKKIGIFHNSDKKSNTNDYEGAQTPIQIENLNTKIVDIASGCHHILLLTEDGNILSFGEGSKGQLGRISREKLESIDEDRQLFLSPQKIEFTDLTIIEKIWSAHWSSYAKSTSGDIYVWGLNNRYQLGLETVINSTSLDKVSKNDFFELSPTNCRQLSTNTVMIANGQHHMLALDSDGQVFSCGNCVYGKLGLGNIDKDVSTPQLIEKQMFDNENVISIACGDFCSFAVTETGKLYSWGQGSKHIGTKECEDLNIPTLIGGYNTKSSRFLSVSSGSQHTATIGIISTEVNGDNSQ